MIIDCISDLHGHYPTLEGGDLLIVAGDLTARDDFMGWQSFATWIAVQNYRKKIFIGGNHDNYLAQSGLIMPLIGPQDLEGVEYLCDSGTEFQGLKIWGSPWTKSFEGMNPDCMAFTMETEEQLAAKWALIPDDTDILITHSPPQGVMDSVEDYWNGKIENVGSKSLQTRVLKISLKLHVFGHIHEWGGQMVDGAIKFVNASHVNENYKPVNKPVRVIL